MVGRLAGLNQHRLQFSGGLRNNCALADLKMNRLLDAIDTHIARNGLGETVQPVERYASTRLERSPRLDLDLRNGEIRSIVWATGFRPDYSWLSAPVFDRRGRLQHDGGVLAAPGLCALGLSFMRRRKSSFIHGAEDDTTDLADHLLAYLAGGRRALGMGSTLVPQRVPAVRPDDVRPGAVRA